MDSLNCSTNATLCVSSPIQLVQTDCCAGVVVLVADLTRDMDKQFNTLFVLEQLQRQGVEPADRYIVLNKARIYASEGHGMPQKSLAITYTCSHPACRHVHRRPSACLLSRA